MDIPRTKVALERHLTEGSFRRYANTRADRPLGYPRDPLRCPLSRWTNAVLRAMDIRGEAWFLHGRSPVITTDVGDVIVLDPKSWYDDVISHVDAQALLSTSPWHNKELLGCMCLPPSLEVTKDVH